MWNGNTCIVLIFFFTIEGFSKAQYIRIWLMGNPKRLSNNWQGLKYSADTRHMYGKEENFNHVVFVSVDLVKQMAFLSMGGHHPVPVGVDSLAWLEQKGRGRWPFFCLPDCLNWDIGLLLDVWTCLYKPGSPGSQGFGLGMEPQHYFTGLQLEDSRSWSSLASIILELWVNSL